MRKLFTSGFFGLALLSFCLPWVTVSCQQQKISTFTGIQMVTGTEVSEPGSGMLGGPAKRKQVEPNVFAVIAVVAAVAAFFMSLIGGRVSIIPGIIGIMVALTLKANIDQDISRQGQGLLNATYEAGFWGYILLLVCGSLSNLIPDDISSPTSQNTSHVTSNHKKCPMCAEIVSFEALLCKHCGNKFDESEVKSAIEQKNRLNTAHYCPRCEMRYPFDKSYCDVCGLELINTAAHLGNYSKPVGKICSMCAETVKAAAKICKHCHHEFKDVEDKHIVSTPSPSITPEKSAKEAAHFNAEVEPIEVAITQKDSTAQPTNSSYTPKNKVLKYWIATAAVVAVATSLTYAYKFKIKSNTDGISGQNETTQVSASKTKPGTSSSTSHKRNNVSPNSYCGIWEYDQYGGKSYFKIIDAGNGRFRFIPGQKYEGNFVWDDPNLTNAKGIYLKYADGMLKGRFISTNFYATHGEEFTYKITLSLKSDNKLTYSVHSSIRGETDVSEATKVGI